MSRLGEVDVVNLVFLTGILAQASPILPRLLELKVLNKGGELFNERFSKILNKNED